MAADQLQQADFVPSAVLGQMLRRAPFIASLFFLLGLVRRERVGRRLSEAEARKQRDIADRQMQLRGEERKGRVRAELHLRQATTMAGERSAFHSRGVEGAEADNADEGPGACEGGFVFHPIGIFQSCYRSRCGTPRQGGIVPESLAVLRCARDLNPRAALEGFEAFSHCWVLYVFHENTNLQRNGRTVARRRQNQGRVPLWQGLCMKVAPPRCVDRELRVGVLACRTPHRPNPIGLSLARVLRVDTARGEVLLAGLDVVDGTPCLDLKPYLPAFESLPSAEVPAWVQASYEEPLMRVEWASAASETLAELTEVGPEGVHEESGAHSARGPRLDVRPFASVGDLRRALEGTLALDIRSPVQRERHPAPATLAQSSPAASDPFFVGDLWFHELHITYALLVELRPGGAPAWVRVERVELRPGEPEL